MGARARRRRTRRIVTEPVYRQLTRALLDELRSGHFPPGSRFLSERETAEQFGVSRATANKVISNLVAEGLLVFRQGVGTFVAEHSLSTSLRDMESFTAQAELRGLSSDSRVLAFRETPAARLPQSVREGLRLEADAQESVYEIERVRLADGEPMILEYRWVRARLLPGLRAADMAGSFYRLLDRRYKVAPGGEDQTITARMLTRAELEKLGVAGPEAALVVEGVGLTQQDEPLWYQVLCYRGDKYAFQNQVRARGTDGAATSVMRKSTAARAVTRR